MIFRTHIAFASLIGFFVYFYNIIDNGILFFLFLFIGAGFPDIDHSKSKFGRNILSRIMSFFSDHRKIFHSLFFGAALAYLFFLYDKDAGAGFFLGFLSHVILDSFTKQGINFLYPLGKLKMKGFIKTGEMLETVLFYTLVVADVVLLSIKLSQSF